MEIGKNLFLEKKVMYSAQKKKKHTYTQQQLQQHIISLDFLFIYYFIY